MAKAFKFALSTTSKFISGNSSKLMSIKKQTVNTFRQCLSSPHSSLSISSRAHGTLSAATARGSTTHVRGCNCSACSNKLAASYSTEVDKEISKFLEKEIQYEQSRSNKELPKIPGFEIKTEGGDVTLTKTSGGDRVVVKLSVVGAVDSIMSENEPQKEDEPPQMVCRPPFQVEISKGDGSVLALQCTFPSGDQMFEEGGQYGSQENEQIDDQFEIQEVAFHGGEWKDNTFSVSAATMDAELFDLLMDMLDERGVNDEFIVHLVDFCTAYENKQYIDFLQQLKKFSEK